MDAKKAGKLVFAMRQAFNLDFFITDKPTLGLVPPDKLLHELENELTKKKNIIDRALPRLVVAASLTEEFGYSRLELTERELGTVLIIEAGTTRR